MALDLNLTADEIAKLQAADKQLADLREAIIRFERAGFDATNLKNNLAAVKAARDGLMREFGPQANKSNK